MSKAGKKPKKDTSIKSQKSSKSATPKSTPNRQMDDDILFETYFHESGKTYCCIVANNQRYYLDSFESGQWLPFPKEWVNKGILIIDDMENNDQFGIPGVKDDDNEIKDDREGTVKIPNKGEFMTYMFERRQNIHCYYDKQEGAWFCLPIKWELYSKSIVNEIRKVKDVCPQWKDEADILASLRANNYNVDSCINNYTITTAIEDSKNKANINTKSIIEEAYNLQNLEKKIKILTEKLNELQNNIRNANEEKAFYQKKNLEMDEQFSTLKANSESMKAQITALQKVKETKKERPSIVDIEVLKKISKLLTILKKTQLQTKSDLVNYKVLMFENFKHLTIKSKSMTKYVGDHGDELETLRNLYRKEAFQRKLLYNQLQELRGNIRVFARIRKDSKAKTTIKVMEDDISIGLPNNLIKEFQYDKVFNVNSKQTEIYKEVSPIITSCADGYNVTILAYGQTGSGKTFTMQGPTDDPGVKIRAIEELLSICNSRKSIDYTLSVSIVEIYNENVHDLLNPKVETVDLRSTGAHNVQVVGVINMTVKTKNDIIRIMGIGEANRKVASTKMNSSSSRSHLIVTLTVSGSDRMSGINTKGNLNLVDLAGSERVSKTDASGARLTEAAFINKSLTSLGQVFTALRTNQLHIPYRNSKLTYLLEPSLGGDAKACLIVNISPDVTNVQETLSTLQFGFNARQVALGQAKANVTKSGQALGK